MSGPAQPLIPVPFVVLGPFSERLPCLLDDHFQVTFPGSCGPSDLPARVGKDQGVSGQGLDRGLAALSPGQQT